MNRKKLGDLGEYVLTAVLMVLIAIPTALFFFGNVIASFLGYGPR